MHWEKLKGDVFFFKQKTAYEIKECDWSSDVCSSDLNFTITVSNANAPVISASVTDISCNGLADGALDLTDRKSVV